MKTKIFTPIVVGCFMMFCLAVVADLTGKWACILQTPNGDMQLNYNFAVNGDQVTGTASTPQGTMAITDGKVSGNDFSFNVSVNGVQVKNTCKYYADGDSISLNIDYSGYMMHSTLKRDTK